MTTATAQKFTYDMALWTIVMLGAMSLAILFIIWLFGMASSSPSRVTDNIRIRLSAVTENWSRLADSRGALAGAQVSIEDLALIYEDCRMMRSTETPLINERLAHAYDVQREQVAQACSAMARLVARNALTYGDFRNFAAKQSIGFNAASAQMALDAQQGRNIESKAYQRAQEVRRNMQSLENWRQQDD